MKDISGNVPKKDKSAIENGMKEYRKEMPDLILGMYVDISLFMKIGKLTGMLLLELKNQSR